MNSFNRGCLSRWEPIAHSASSGQNDPKCFHAIPRASMIFNVDPFYTSTILNLGQGHAVAALGPPESLAKDSRPTFDAHI